MAYKSEAAKRADEKRRSKRFRKTLVINPDTDPVLFSKAKDLDDSGKLNKVLKDAVMDYEE